MSKTISQRLLGNKLKIGGAALVALGVATLPVTGKIAVDSLTKGFKTRMVDALTGPISESNTAVVHPLTQSEIADVKKLKQHAGLNS